MPQSIDRIIILTILLLLAACSSSTSSSTPLPLNKLSKTAIFSIAGQHLHLPLVAVSWGGSSNAMVLCTTPATRRFCSIPFDEIAKQAMESRKLVPVKALRIKLDSYNNYMDTREDSYIPIPELCPKLLQKWAQIACKKGLEWFLHTICVILSLLKRNT